MLKHESDLYKRLKRSFKVSWGAASAYDVRYPGTVYHTYSLGFLASLNSTKKEIETGYRNLNDAAFGTCRLLVYGYDYGRILLRSIEEDVGTDPLTGQLLYSISLRCCPTKNSTIFDSRNAIALMRKLPGQPMKICKREDNFNKPLYVDHNHNTGEIRGLLCNGYNAGLGHFKDNIDNLNSAINYLKDNNGNN